jgi:DNA-directed RNA polymerase subunit RPC12/RpoP
VIAIIRKYFNPLKIRNTVIWMFFVASFLGFIGGILESVWLLSLNIILFLIFIVVSFIFWRCPNCKRRLPLRYDKEIELSYAYVCPRCEKRFFDDGTME